MISELLTALVENRINTKFVAVSLASRSPDEPGEPRLCHLPDANAEVAQVNFT